jgi:hypothetical protein
VPRSAEKAEFSELIDVHARIFILDETSYFPVLVLLVYIFPLFDKEREREKVFADRRNRLLFC